LTFSSLDDIIKSTHAIDAKGGRLPIGIPGRLQIGMHGRLRRYPHLFALASIAGNDAAVAVFDAKYHYNFWRPITAIRNADIT